MDKNRIKQMIRNGEGKKFYAEWAKHEDSAIRYTLAQMGYYPEIFIDDKQLAVREMALRAQPEYLTKLLGTKENLMIVNEYLEEQADIQVAVLEQHIQDMENYKSGYYIEDMKAKLKALKHQPNPIETTMTPLQLYKTGSPLWALPFRPQAIYEIQVIENGYGKDIATPLLDPTLTGEESCRIYWSIDKMMS